MLQAHCHYSLFCFLLSFWLNKNCVVAWTLSLLWVKFEFSSSCSRWLLGVVGWLISFCIIWVFNSPNNLSYIQKRLFLFFFFFDSVSRLYLWANSSWMLFYMGIDETTTAMRAWANNETACWINRLMYTVLAYDSVLNNCTARVFVSGEHQRRGKDRKRSLARSNADQSKLSIGMILVWFCYCRGRWDR